MGKSLVVSALLSTIPGSIKGDIAAGIEARIQLRELTQAVEKHEEIKNSLDADRASPIGGYHGI